MATTRRISIVLGILMVGASIGIQLWTAIYVLCGVLLMYQYSAQPIRAKDKPILGLLAFSQAVCVPYVLGILLEPMQTIPWLVPPALSSSLGFGLPDPALKSRAIQACEVLLLIAFWFVAKGTFKNLVDYAGDRACGLKTSASVFSSRRRAMIPVAVLTTIAYLAPLIFPALHFPGRIAWASLWGPLAIFNAWRLARIEDPAATNSLLRVDMIISSGFAASLLLLLFPQLSSLVVVLVGAGIIVVSDFLRLDSRKTSDAVPWANEVT